MLTQPIQHTILEYIALQSWVWFEYVSIPNVDGVTELSLAVKTAQPFSDHSARYGGNNIKINIHVVDLVLKMKMAWQM